MCTSMVPWRMFAAAVSRVPPQYKPGMATAFGEGQSDLQAAKLPEADGQSGEDEEKRNPEAELDCDDYE